MSKINLKTTSEPSAIRSSSNKIEDKRAISEKQALAVKNNVSDDNLKFSDRAATIGKLVEKLEEVPNIRLDRVEALREKIAAGEYKPEARDIANAILKDEK